MIKFSWWLKLNSHETLVSQALIDIEISHEEFITILKEKDKYEKMKDNLRSEYEIYEIMRFSSMIFYVKNYSVFYVIKKIFLCMYKMYLISAEGYINAGAQSLRVHKAGEISQSMKDVWC